MERLVAGITPGAELATVVDSETGETIAAVISADAVEGKVKRYAIRDGSYVVEHGEFVCIEEDRAIRIVMPEVVAVDAPAAEGDDAC